MRDYDEAAKEQLPDQDGGGRSAGLARAASRVGRAALFTAKAAAYTGLGVAAYANIVERRMFALRRHVLPVLPPGIDPIRILHISDLHIAPYQKWKEDWVRDLAQIQPDLVVNTGDNLSHRDALPALHRALDPLLDFPGLFVPGSNDYTAPTPRNPLKYLTGPSSSAPSVRKRHLPLPSGAMHEMFGRRGWINMTNRNHTMGFGRLRLDITGVDDPHLGFDRYQGFPRVSVNQDLSPSLRLGLLHAPYRRVLDQFTADAPDLLLAGHTHGGQIRVPGYGALISNCDLPTTLARGLTRWSVGGHSTYLNVSAGLGNSPYFPFRFACRPEATLLTLVERAA